MFTLKIFGALTMYCSFVWLHDRIHTKVLQSVFTVHSKKIGVCKLEFVEEILTRKMVGLIGILVSGLLLSLKIYMLKIINL